MSRTTLTVATTALAAAALTAVLATATGASSAATREHVQNFDATPTAQLATSPASFVLAEQDVAASQVIGHDVLFCAATRTHSNCQVAFAQKGGLIYAQFLLRDSDHSITGSVTGGTGIYRHAHGTITGQAISQSDVRVALRYQI